MKSIFGSYFFLAFQRVEFKLNRHPPPHKIGFFVNFWSIYLVVFGQNICFCCEFLVDMPSSIWTGLAHFTSIYLSVFGHVLRFLHLSNFLILVFRYISVPTPPSPHPKSGFFDKLQQAYLSVFRHFLPFYVDTLRSNWTRFELFTPFKMLKFVFL